jgi:hypothetical protein
MRLLERKNDGEFTLTKDIIDNIPNYTILSHTLGADTEEVTFRDLTDGTGKDKTGYNKIRFCGEQARHDGLQYFWVDTCCIDKSNNAELAEAINSMFRWYRHAAKCYVYLSDVPRDAPDADDAFCHGASITSIVSSTSLDAALDLLLFHSTAFGVWTRSRLD